MAGSLLYNFSDCASPSPVNTPIARRGLTYRKIREASGKTADTVERKASNALSQLSGTGNVPTPRSLQATDNENAQTSRHTSYSEQAHQSRFVSRRTTSYEAVRDFKANHLIDITSSVNNASHNNDIKHNSTTCSRPSIAGESEFERTDESIENEAFRRTSSTTTQSSDEDSPRKHEENTEQSTGMSKKTKSMRATGDRCFRSFIKTLGLNSSKQVKSNREQEVQKQSASDGKTDTLCDLTSHLKSGGSQQCVESIASTSQPVNLSARTSCKNERTSILRRSTDTARLPRGGERQSIDGYRSVAHAHDEAVQQRAIQRRRKLRELIQSEESYVADLKVLLNVYLVLLGSATQSPTRILAHFQQNVGDILRLHQDLLSRLTPFKIGDSHASTDPLDTQEVRDVVQIFDLLVSIVILSSSPVGPATASSQNQMSRFFVYEEYGARFQVVARNLATVSRAVPTWTAYERGIEALAHSLGCASDNGGRRGLSFEDLLIKVSV